ncbi:MAG: hypothetical protein NC131_09445 [Roseburia sp.]|nr:hypothetical protein [Roseburia sp.]
MAKKKTKSSSTTTSNYGIVKPLAFWGIIISGIAGFITLIIKILVACKLISGAGSAIGTIISILNLLANLALFVSVFLAAHAYSKSKSQTWQILFWIFSVLAFLSLLGFNILGMVGF